MLTERLVQPQYRDVVAAQAEHEQQLLELPNVVGVAVSHKQAAGRDTGKPCVAVLVDLKLDKELLSRNELIPAKVGSVPTDVIEVGVLQAGAGPALVTPRPSTDWLDPSVREREQEAWQTMAE